VCHWMQRSGWAGSWWFDSCCTARRMRWQRGAFSPVSRMAEHVMKTYRRSLVEDSLALLREVRAGLHNESNRELVAALDEAIAMLEVILIQGSIRADHTEKVLKVLGQGLAALPVLQRLIELLKD
jgi:hypothetical protein